MINGNPRQFDLYDFFSVLLPGVALLLGLFPFLPNTTDVTALGAIVPVLVGGFVVGRAIHSLTVTIEKPPVEDEMGFVRTLFIAKPLGVIFGNEYTSDVTHRERFVSELQNGGSLDADLLDHFYEVCRMTFPGLDLPDERTDELPDDKIDALYGLVRSAIHVDARGRSRTFQAVYAFYRSMWLVAFVLSAAYISYGVLRVFDVHRGLVRYDSFIGSVGVPDVLIILGSIVAAYGGYVTFNEARKDYQKYYVQYLISDFIVLWSEPIREPNGIGVPDPGDDATPTGGEATETDS